MPYSEKLFACVTCGAAVFARRPASWEARCINCAIERSIENVRQMRSRDGAFYQRWADGMARAASEAQGLARAAIRAERRGR